MKNKNDQKENLVFSRENYILMIAGVVTMIIGFMLMTGGGSDDPNVFNEDEIYSFRRITLAPIVVFIGYALEIFAIFKRPKRATEDQ